MNETVVTRSSSFSSCDLVSYRKSSMACRTRGFLPLLNYLHLDETFVSESCLVNYLLACSYSGTSFLNPTSIFNSTNLFGPHCYFRPMSSNTNLEMNNSNSIESTIACSINNGCCMSKSKTNLMHHYLKHNLNVDWRRGCSDNLVLILNHHKSGSKICATSIDKLLVGRFLPGPDLWRFVWPDTGDHGDRTNGLLKSKQLANWFANWIRLGSVPVLAQLYSNQTYPVCVTTKSTESQVGQELNWSHRMVYGVTQNGMCCSDAVLY